MQYVAASKADHEAASISFAAGMKAGKYQLRTIVYDDKGRELCGAFYTRVERE